MGGEGRGGKRETSQRVLCGLGATIPPAPPYLILRRQIRLEGGPCTRGMPMAAQARASLHSVRHMRVPLTNGKEPERPSERKRRAHGDTEKGDTERGVGTRVGG